MSERVKKLSYFGSWEVKMCVSPVNCRNPSWLIDKVGVLQKRFHVLGCGWPSCFLLEARSVGKLKTSQCFDFFFLLRRCAECS